MTMQYGFMGDPNSRGGPQNLFGGDPGLFPYFSQTGNPGMGMFRQRSVTPGMGPQGRAGLPQSSPLYGGGGVTFMPGYQMTGGMQNPVQGQFSSRDIFGDSKRTPSPARYMFGPGGSFAATQFGQQPVATTDFGFNPDRPANFGLDPFGNMSGDLYDPTLVRNRGIESTGKMRQDMLNPFGEARPRRLDPRYEESAEMLRKKSNERQRDFERREREFERGEVAKKATGTNVSPDRRQTRTGTGSVPGNPPRKRQEQYKPGLQRRQRGALGDQSIFRQRQTPRRRAASSAGEG